MKKFVVFIIALVLSGAGSVGAETYRAELNASSAAVFAGVDAKQYVTQGYMKYGASAFYVDTSKKEYSLFDVKLMVGSETLLPDLHFEVGFKGILGSAEDENDDGSLGAVAFTGVSAYRLPQSLSPIPVQFYLGLSGSPRPLSFLDSRNYFDVKTGVDIYVVENAALQLSYRYYDIELEDWDFKDDRLMVGIAIEF